MSTTPPFQELLVISNDETWVWQFLKTNIDQQKLRYIKLKSSTSIRHSWQRFKDADRIIIHWESNERNGGAIVEEILDVAPQFDVAEKVIIVTTNPLREDVVYCSELGLRRIIRLRPRDRELEFAGRELKNHLHTAGAISDTEILWRRLIRAIDLVPTNAAEERFFELETKLDVFGRLEPKETARYLDAKGCLRFKQNNFTEAESFWRTALEQNPNYFRSYNNLIRLYTRTDRLHAGFALMKKMQNLNPANISRLVDMGNVHAQLGDDMRAEHYYRSALEKDPFGSRALNGLAAVRFRSGELDESRRLLARSSLAYELAREFNVQGIAMVHEGRHKEALEHYMKAQYVIPQQEKGPLLFYNIGLCYSRWGKMDMAAEFLKLALIKEPTYEKARHLLETVIMELSRSQPKRAAS